MADQQKNKVGFNQSAFMSQSFSTRTSVVKIEALKDWFDADVEPEFKVRGLTANELAIANDALARNLRASAMVTALDSGNNRELTNELRKSLGFTNDVRGEVAKRMEMLKMGCVEPELPLEVCVKIAENFPIEFYQLTNEITTLTGKGSEAVKKQRGSGQTKK